MEDEPLPELSASDTKTEGSDRRAAMACCALAAFLPLWLLNLTFYPERLYDPPYRSEVSPRLFPDWYDALALYILPAHLGILLAANLTPRARASRASSMTLWALAALVAVDWWYVADALPTRVLRRAGMEGADGRPLDAGTTEGVWDPIAAVDLLPLLNWNVAALVACLLSLELYYRRSARRKAS